MKLVRYGAQPGVKSPACSTPKAAFALERESCKSRLCQPANYHQVRKSLSYIREFAFTSGRANIPRRRLAMPCHRCRGD